MPVNDPAAPAFAQSALALGARFAALRAQSVALAAPLSAEDCVVQSMPDASPVKWHLAHTTWFLETMILGHYVSGYRVFDDRFGKLFNSYYESLGPRHPRPLRGLLTRPTLEEVLSYRAAIDTQLMAWLGSPQVPASAIALIDLGLNHERQHQELMLTDLKHLLFKNPLAPVYRSTTPPAPPSRPDHPLAFVAGVEGVHEIGHQGETFAFDNELPRHRCYVAPHALASRPVSNAEYRNFIDDGGYRRPEFWLSDGWNNCQTQGWERPLYWSESLTEEFTLSGFKRMDPMAPVCHVSYYESDAYARWSGGRLPTEEEWELAATGSAVSGNFADSGLFHPRSAVGSGLGLRQLFGDVWEWTSSAYAPYPGFRTAAGAVGEYNGKFMANQMVLKGGSCASYADHIRASYRNFFYPDARWQFSGIRLARDLEN